MTIRSPSNTTLLLIDDDDDLRLTLRDLLSEAGFRVCAAADGTAGVSELDESDFDIVVTDWDVPDLGGFELIDRLRDRQPDGPIVVMTGHPTAPLDELDVEGILRKPFNLVELLETLDRTL